MANLANCTVTTYTAQEFEGDSFLQDNITAQVYNEETQPEKVYKLVVSSNTGYHVQASYLTINEIEPDYISSTSSFAYGVRYWLSPNIENVNQIWIGDLGIPGEPDNTVEIHVLLEDSFVMPASDYTINIDIDGDAELYSPPYNETVFLMANNFTMMNFDNVIEQQVQGGYVNQLQIEDGSWVPATIFNDSVSPTIINVNNDLMDLTDTPTNNELIKNNLVTTSILENGENADSSQSNFLVQNPSGNIVNPVVGIDLPSSLLWFIRISDLCGECQSLQADSTFINIYHAITWYYDANGELVVIPYTSSNNECAININSNDITLTQNGCQQMTISIPLNPNFLWPTQSSLTGVVDTNPSFPLSVIHNYILYTCWSSPPAAADDPCQPDSGGDTGLSGGMTTD